MPKHPTALLGILLSSMTLAQSPVPPGSWKQVQGLGPHSKILIKSDKKTAVCYVHFVAEQELTCSRSEEIGAETLTFSRAEVKSIKLARGGTLGGAALSLTDRVKGMNSADALFAGTTIYQRSDGKM